MCLKIGCDREFKNFCKIFWELNWLKMSIETGHTEMSVAGHGGESESAQDQGHV
jgi:hypothetical protein